MKRFLFLLLAAILVLLTPQYTEIIQANPMPTQLRVGLVDRFGGRDAIHINNTSIMLGHTYLQSANGFTVRPYGSHEAALYDGSHRLQIFDSQTQIRDAYDGMIRLDSVSYRGAVMFARLGGQGITAVNILGLEEYLFSVVPSEMPATWHQEALRAQAVAARTYALRILNHGSPHTGFDLCDRVCCQVYRGTEREHENSTQAVLATAGLAAYFNGQLIDAVYFASSGGMTENSENVWQEARPYLRSVSDPHEFEPVTWTRTFTLTEITNLLSHNNRFIGNATGMAIGGTHPSGRVESLVIHGTNGQAVLTREEIRTFFSSSAEGSLMSRHFTLGGSQVSAAAADVVVSDGVQQINLSAIGLHGINAQGAISTMVTFNATDGLSTVIYGPANPQLMATTGDTIVITGRGFGHGVGMSQRGAEGMARNGYGFREILTHFYTGIVIH